MVDYKQRHGLLTSFTEMMEKLIIELLNDNKINFHSVTSRVKEESSLYKNLSESTEEITELEDIHDLAGLRITTYFSDDVDLVAAIIEKEFDIDEQNSVDKRSLLDPDRFGYLSIHYVVKLTETRSKLAEYKRFVKCQAEIQIRSILQHAWAEIEHDLGYKTSHAVPKHIRRQFSRLAGLLEVADDEFLRIRDSLLKYEKEVSSKIISSPEEVLINQASLRAFIEESEIVKELDLKIASFQKVGITEATSLDTRIKQLHCVNVETIADLDALLHREAENILKFAEMWLTGTTDKRPFERGICIFYLNYILISKQKSIEKVVEYLERGAIGGRGEKKELARRILATYSKLSKI